jgi:hypothetical protein
MNRVPSLSHHITPALVNALEELFQSSFRDVEIVIDPAPARYRASALAWGNVICLSSRWGRREPTDVAKVLAHELAHVVQWRTGRALADRTSLEVEAEAAARAFATSAFDRVPPLLVGSRRGRTCARRVLCQPDWKGNTWWGGRTRAPQFGDVTIRFEAILTRTRTIVRPIQVMGLVAPGSTTGRPAAPEPICGWRVGMEARVPSAYAYNPETGANYGNTGMGDAEKGHLMALELGGPDIRENIVPQYAKWQGCGEWRRMEEVIKKDAEQLLRQNRTLMYDCVVVYSSTGKLSMRRMCVPKGFRVQTTECAMNGTQLGNPVIRFNGDQIQDETDDMLALREFEEIERSKEPEFRMSDLYSDVTEKKKRGRQVLAFGPDGQDARHRPPPLTFLTEPTAYFVKTGSPFALNKSVGAALPIPRTAEPEAEPQSGRKRSRSESDVKESDVKESEKKRARPDATPQ